MACGRARLPGGVDAEEEWQARRRMLDQGEQQVQLSRQVRRSSGVGAFQALDAPKWRESDGVKGNRHDLWTQAGATSARRCRLVSDVRCEHWHPSRRTARTHERSEERRVGKEWVSKCRSRGSP